MLAVPTVWFRAIGNDVMFGVSSRFCLVGQERRRILGKFTGLAESTGKVFDSVLDFLSLMRVR